MHVLVRGFLVFSHFRSKYLYTAGCEQLAQLVEVYGGGCLVKPGRCYLTSRQIKFSISILLFTVRRLLLALQTHVHALCYMPFSMLLIVHGFIHFQLSTNQTSLAFDCRDSNANSHALFLFLLLLVVINCQLVQRCWNECFAWMINE